MGQRANTALVDIDFLLGSHHKLTGLSEVDRCRYLALWALATKLGREMLPIAYQFDDLSALRSAIGVQSGRNSLQNTLSKLLDCNLIARQKQRIVVVGLKDRMKSRSIDGYVDSDCIDSVRSGLDRSGSLLEEAAPAQKAEPSAPEKKTPKKSSARESENRILEKVRSLWLVRFGRGTVPDYPLLRKIIKLCETADVAPWWVFRYAVEHQAKDPLRYVMFILNSKDRPWPDESGTSYVKWECDVFAEKPGNPGRGINVIGKVMRATAQEGVNS